MHRVRRGVARVCTFNPTRLTCRYELGSANHASLLRIPPLRGKYGWLALLELTHFYQSELLVTSRGEQMDQLSRRCLSRSVTVFDVIDAAMMSQNLDFVAAMVALSVQMCLAQFARAVARRLLLIEDGGLRSSDTQRSGVVRANGDRISQATRSA